jgi:hypothetical protein
MLTYALWVSFEGTEAIWHAVPTLARHSKVQKVQTEPKTSGHLIIFNYLF